MLGDQDEYEDRLRAYERIDWIDTTTRTSIGSTSNEYTKIGCVPKGSALCRLKKKNKEESVAGTTGIRRLDRRVKEECRSDRYETN